MHYVPTNQKTIIRYWIATTDYASPGGNKKEEND